MKAQRQKILSLLSSCAENHGEAEKLRCLDSIVGSKEYQELQQNAILGADYQASYSIPQLTKLDPPELTQRKTEITALAKMLRLLKKSILFGNAPALQEMDFPAFRDVNAITNISKQLVVGDSIKNYSNIDEEHCLKVFDASTIKSPEACFELLPLSVSQKAEINEKDIQDALNGRLYCIDIAKVHAVHRDFLAFSAQAEEQIQKDKQKRGKRCLFKVAAIMILFGVLFTCHQFEWLTFAELLQISPMLLLSAVVFMIWG